MAPSCDGPTAPSSDDKGPYRYYSGANCESCQRMEKTEMKEEHDDGDFAYDDVEDYGGDEELRLRVIHYNRQNWVSGCFDVDCPPRYGGIGGQPFNGKHYAHKERFNKTVVDCARFAVDTYNEAKEGEELEYVGHDNVAVEGCGWWKFFLTMRCKDVGKRIKNVDGESADSVKTYRVLVACCYWKQEDKRLLVFKDSDGNNLLEPHGSFDIITEMKPRRPCPPDWKPTTSDEECEDSLER